MASEKTPIKKCGTVAVIGAPNAGKSTLVNGLVGAKVTIVSPNVQTTRNRVMGIAMRTTPDIAAQIILVDTPGIFAPKLRLDSAMVGQPGAVRLKARLARQRAHQCYRGIAWYAAPDGQLI